MSNPIHTPVLLEETINFLNPCGDSEFMIDGTLGEGGHSEAFLTRFPGLRICGIDADNDILQAAKERLKSFEDRISFYAGWSEDFFVEFLSKVKVNAELRRPGIILLDLGVSLYHYEKGDRGFSFLKDEALDMRIDTGCGTTAAELLLRLKENELADLLYNNAQERFSRRIARVCVDARKLSRITSSAQLAELVSRAVPSSYRYGAAHPATKTFQALRIAVNGELEKLTARLRAALKLLGKGGRLGVITFHSLEDRIVKNFFRSAACEENGLENGLWKIITKKPIAPCAEEVKRNPPSRSAKLRVMQCMEEYAE
ncbi:MAG: 16S rRNA (cytosine(1402)-N(4))-methyltransferase RsmH [Spirochaetaceae bacterium]|jgi:16S rRNA (cytosine1402-N4)-methyltransferase|nr:16S rRNA (cytosine(1402)-N(4))-methyltransferase RsmH [Spirochaetaceae bacterium]